MTSSSVSRQEVPPDFTARKQARGHLPSRCSWDLLGLVALVLLAALPELGKLAGQVFGTDESILLVYPEQLLLGRVPNRDFFTVYGIGNYGLLAGVYSALGPTFYAERLVGLAYHVFVVLGLRYAVRSLGPTVSFVAGALGAFVLLPLTLTAYSWFGGLALGLWSLGLLANRTGSRGAILSGFLAGLVFAWRLEMGVLCLAAIPLVLKSRHWRWYIGGLSIGLLPLACHLALAGRQIFENVFLDRLAINAQMAIPVEVRIALALCLVSVTSLAIQAARTRDRTLAGFALFCCLIVPQSLQRTDMIHVQYVACISLPLAVAVSLRGIRVPVRAARGAVIAMASVATALGASSLLITPAGADVTTYTHDGRSMPTSDPYGLARLVAAVERAAPPRSHLFVGATDMSRPTATDVFLYHLLPEYRADGYFLELPPGVAEHRGSPLVADIVEADVLVLTKANPVLDRINYPYMARGDGAANLAVARHFCEVADLPSAQVLVRCHPHAARPR